MARNSLLCADVPLRHYSLVTLTQSFVSFYHILPAAWAGMIYAMENFVSCRVSPQVSNQK